MERILVLYDSDEHYARRFMEYFKKKQDLGLSLAVFTRLDSLLDYMQQNPVDILLLGESVSDMTGELNTGKAKHIYKLADKTARNHEAGWMLIDKYQMVQSIISDIKADYIRHESENASVKSDKLRLISIISPIQDLSSIVFAWSVGLLLSEQARVFLVSLELLPVRIISTSDYSNQPLTELIYYIKENIDIVSHMKTLACYQGALSYLAGIANGADILALNKEDMQRWIAAITTSADYELVIFYACCNSEATQELIKASDRVIYCCGEGIHEELLYGEWMNQLERTSINLTQDKFIKLQLPEETRISRLPLTAVELGDSDCWNFARQCLDIFY